MIKKKKPWSYETQNPLKKCKESWLFWGGIIKEITMSKRNPSSGRKTTHVTVLGFKNLKKKSYFVSRCKLLFK